MAQEELAAIVCNVLQAAIESLAITAETTGHSFPLFTK
jgi:hypothetical protein